MIDNAIIYLIGFAGVGKLTIAKEIVEQTNLILIHNHLINNPILSVVEVDGKSALPPIVREKIDVIRNTVLETIIELSPKNFSFIFTNELIEGKKADMEIFQSIEEVAKKRKSLFLPVRLICDEETLCERVVSEDRKENFKLTDKKVTIEKIRNKKLFTPPIDHITIDVTQLSAKQSAEEILAEIAKMV
jgi:adenylate kinase family enzyme